MEETRFTQEYDSMEDLSGRQFGPYRVVEPCGEGGMAAVFKGYQANMDRYVALKVLPRYFASDPEFVGRFEQEAKVLARLQHPHILPVHDFGETDGYTYIVMPFVESGSLADLLQDDQPLSLAQIDRIIAHVGDALDYAHSQGVVHRDVKPSNVLVDQRGNCMLTDFGIAKIVEGTAAFTRTGGMIGTPAYMSPEQILGETVDGRADVYSLGIVLYEMAAGRPPFRAETPPAILVKHLHDPLPSPREFNPALPEAIERVILKALAKDPDDRFQTASEIAAAVGAAALAKTSAAEAVGGPAPLEKRTRLAATIKAAVPPREEKKRRLPAWVFAIAGVVVVGMIAALAGLADRGDTSNEDNTDTDVALSGGEVEWVELELHANNVSGCVPNGPITITTAVEQRVIDGECFSEWFDDRFEPGDVVTVAAGSGAYPVVIEIPKPFTAQADSKTDTVWGQIGGLDQEWVEVKLCGYETCETQNVQIDGSGDYSAHMSDVPRGGQGEVRYRAEIDFADVTFRRLLQTADLVLRVEYSADSVCGEGYDPGYTVWITVTDEIGAVKATAIANTVPDIGWGVPGFWVQGNEWLPGPPDIVPGDWVYGLMDNGQATQVHIGEITGTVDTENDSVSGQIYADWFTETLHVDCHPWAGSPPEAPPKQSTAGPNGDPPYHCQWDPGAEWDVQAGQEIGVWYIGPDFNWVSNGFQ